jgi:hypothetical protein
MSVMTIFYDPEYERLSDLTATYWTYDEEKRKFIIPEDAPKEIHEAAKKQEELWEKYQEY